MQVQDDKPYDDINITPMLDLAYVLLVIFILMCTASVQGLKVNLPQGTSSSKSLAGQKIQAITVNKEGKYFLNTQPVSLQELGPRVASLRAANPQLQIVLKGEGAAEYQRVMDVMNVLGQNGFDKFGIATKPEKK
jgi:biopolymer transport protein ExbD